MNLFFFQPHSIGSILIFKRASMAGSMFLYHLKDLEATILLQNLRYCWKVFGLPICSKPEVGDRFGFLEH